MNKTERIEVRDSTTAEEAIDKLLHAIQRPVDHNNMDWINRVKNAAADVAYQEALSRIGSKSVRR